MDRRGFLGLLAAFRGRGGDAAVALGCRRRGGVAADRGHRPAAGTGGGCALHAAAGGEGGVPRSGGTGCLRPVARGRPVPGAERVCRHGTVGQSGGRGFGPGALCPVLPRDAAAGEAMGVCPMGRGAGGADCGRGHERVAGGHGGPLGGGGGDGRRTAACSARRAGRSSPCSPTPGVTPTRGCWPEWRCGCCSGQRA